MLFYQSTKDASFWRGRLSSTIKCSHCLSIANLLLAYLLMTAMPSMAAIASEIGISDPGFDQKSLLNLKAQGLFNEELVGHVSFDDAPVIDVTSVKTAEQVLSILLDKEKQTPESRYSQFAIKYYESLTEELQNTPPLMFSYALHLGNLHRFHESLTHFKTLVSEHAFATNARLQIINIYMLQGKTEQAAYYCNGLKGQDNPLLAVICGLWIRGVSESDEQASQLLSNIGGKLSEQDPLYFWVHDILLDVQLQLRQPDAAYQTLSKLKPLLTHDIAPVLQLVDYHLVGKEFAKGQSLLKEYDPDGQYWLRHAIASGEAFEDLALIQRQLIDFYQLRADPSKYFITSLWLRFNAKQYKEAKLLALSNWQHYQKINDRLLLELNDALDNIDSMRPSS